MTQDYEIPALVDVMLRLLLRQPIIASDADAGIDILLARAGNCTTPDDWRAAAASALAAGYIHEPVILSHGALHCHWRLELTPHGIDAAARLL